eukprot:COSAG06_NODE_5315_length_3568_cov_172.997694_4_plen_184_part_00
MALLRYGIVHLGFGPRRRRSFGPLVEGAALALTASPGGLLYVLIAGGTERCRCRHLCEAGLLAASAATTERVPYLCGIRRLFPCPSAGAAGWALGGGGGLNRPAPRAQNTPFCVSSIDVPCAVRGNFAVDLRHRYGEPPIRCCRWRRADQNTHCCALSRIKPRRDEDLRRVLTPPGCSGARSV